MSLRAKFNLMLILVFLAGLLVAGYVTRSLLQANAEEEAMEVARLMIEGARAVRKYTVDEVKPLLARLPGDEFLPQSVPAYAAGRNLDHIRELFTEYSYKEAVLNPTNPPHRATDWETEPGQRAESAQPRLTGNGSG